MITDYAFRTRQGPIATAYLPRDVWEMIDAQEPWDLYPLCHALDFQRLPAATTPTTPPQSATRFLALQERRRMWGSPDETVIERWGSGHFRIHKPTGFREWVPPRASTATGQPFHPHGWSHPLNWATTHWRFRSLTPSRKPQGLPIAVLEREYEALVARRARWILAAD